jgi:hypothetical protein
MFYGTLVAANSPEEGQTARKKEGKKRTNK